VGRRPRWSGTGDAVLFSVTTDKQKARNLARDPRVALTVFDIESPYESVEIRGTVELIEDTASQLPKQLSHRYLGGDPPADPDGTVRLIARVIPEKVHRFSA